MRIQQLVSMFSISSLVLTNGALAGQFSEAEGYIVSKPYGMHTFPVDVPCLEDRLSALVPEATFKSEVGVVSAVSESRTIIVGLHGERAESDIGMVSWLSVKWDGASSTILYETEANASFIETHAAAAEYIDGGARQAMQIEGEIQACMRSLIIS